MTGHADGAADFDFLHGSWSVRHRKLRRRLAGDDAWIAFEGTMTARPILAGAGNIDENLLHDPDGSYAAVTLRMFDPASGQWSIVWIDDRVARPDPPVIGRFQNGDGVFLGEDQLDGRPILVRFLWSAIGVDGARWEQSFSGDDGGTWQPNWIMEFERRS
ncbi:MAG: DUF1579 domain-containing protein [Sphingomonas sp.]